MDRINDAVTRILGVKLAMGLIRQGNSTSDGKLLDNEEYVKQKVENMQSNNPTKFTEAWEASLDAA